MAEIKLKPKAETKKRTVRRKKVKAGEDRTQEAFTAQGLAIFKFTDRRVCPHCGALQPKPETQPDFIVGLDWIYVETKESEADGYWRFADPEAGLRKNQRARMDHHEGYLFLVMREPGGGSPPYGESAYLVPYKVWLNYETLLLDQGIKSVRRTEVTRVGKAPHSAGTELLLQLYKLEWRSLQGGLTGHYIIPKDFRYDQH